MGSLDLMKEDDVRFDEMFDILVGYAKRSVIDMGHEGIKVNFGTRDDFK